MADGDAQAARSLFEKLAARHGTREVLAGLATCALTAGDIAAAQAALARALRTVVPDEIIVAIAEKLDVAWCGLSLDGRVQGTKGLHLQFVLEGQGLCPWTPLGPAAPDPHLLAKALALHVTQAGQPLLGSPVDIQAITRTEGFVARERGGVAGWAWHPASPETDPVLRVIVDGHERTLTAHDLTVGVAGTTPLARPRGFKVTCPAASTVRVLDHNGRDLLGSPLGGRVRARPAPRPTAAQGVAVIVPVYRGLAQTLACLGSVRATITPVDRLIVVNDASPEPALIHALQTLAREGAITLIASDPADPTRNRGFPAAANAGLRAAAGRDAVLLNSDTIVYPGWLAGLHAAAHAAPDIGTATPLSNQASIFTYPAPGEPAPMLDQTAGAGLAALALAANAGLIVDVPTGHGFCLYIRADCLHAVGLLRPDLFAQGYGEENDFCERAHASGWRHVAAPAVYVGHEGGVSFAAAREHLMARNVAILDRLYPTYHARIAAFIAADPLCEARARLDEARLTAAADRDAVLLISHAGHGGTTRFVAERAAAARQSGLRPLILRGSEGVSSLAEEGQDTPNLRFTLPADLPALSRLLGMVRVVRAEVHHLLGHGHAIGELLDGLALPFKVWVHDYLWLCARLALVTGEGRFCGEPPVQACTLCVARWGDALEVPITPPELRARSAALLGRAQAVIVPSADVARRIRRHFPQALLHEAAWEADPPARAARLACPASGTLIVAVVGAIGMEKGYDVLLACARDAAARALRLHFTVVGFTPDDEPLLATGHAFVTGPFRAEAAGATITAAHAHLALLPSIWPETWCYALSDCWAAGLDAAVFDIGTPAERVRRTGRGWILPLGLPPARVNDALLNLLGPASRS